MRVCISDLHLWRAKEERVGAKTISVFCWQRRDSDSDSDSDSYHGITGRVPGLFIFIFGHFEFTFSSRRKHGLLINDSELIRRTAYTVTTYRGAIR
jgi:hypothetical protein